MTCAGQSVAGSDDSPHNHFRKPPHGIAQLGSSKGRFLPRPVREPTTRTLIRTKSTASKPPIRTFVPAGAAFRKPFMICCGSMSTLLIVLILLLLLGGGGGFYYGGPLVGGGIGGLLLVVLIVYLVLGNRS